ncbi:hypothetical protein ACP70R_041019 [Stipagrostis hirtigluma subsp. patula]
MDAPVLLLPPKWIDGSSAVRSKGAPCPSLVRGAAAAPEVFYYWIAMEGNLLLCKGCGQLVRGMEGLKNHNELSKHSVFYVPIDGILRLVCSDPSCSTKEPFSHLVEAEMHMQDAKHTDLKETNTNNSGMVSMMVKNDLVTSLLTEGCTLIHSSDLAEGTSDLYGMLGCVTPLSGQHSAFDYSVGGLSSQMASCSLNEDNSPDDICQTPAKYHLSISQVSKGSGAGSASTSTQFERSNQTVSYEMESFRTLAALRYGLDDIRNLRRLRIITEDVSNIEGIRRIKEILSSCDPDKDIFAFDVPDLSSSQIVFDDAIQQFCISRKMVPYSTQTGSETSQRKAFRLGRLLMIVKELLETKTLACINEFHYKYPDIFSKQNSGHDIAHVSAMLGVTREALNIRADPKGLFAGNVLLFVDNRLIADGRLGGTAGNQIPSEVHTVNGIATKGTVKYILVVEKQTVFHALVSSGFHTRHRCILMTGKGHPDVVTRLLLRKLRVTLNVRAYCLVDGNPSGASIYCTYRFGSENRAYDNLCMTVSDLIWIGVFPEDVKDDKHKRALDKCPQRHISMLDNMVMKFVKFPNVLRRLEALHSHKKTLDIDAIERTGELEKYILDRIKSADDALDDKIICAKEDMVKINWSDEA